MFGTSISLWIFLFAQRILKNARKGKSVLCLCRFRLPWKPTEDRNKMSQNMLKNKLCSLTKEEIIYCRKIFLKISLETFSRRMNFNLGKSPFLLQIQTEKFPFCSVKIFLSVLSLLYRDVLAIEFIRKINIKSI